MPPKSRISNLLTNFDFSIDNEQEESSPVSQGESALNDLLSRSKKKEQVSFNNPNY